MENLKHWKRQEMSMNRPLSKISHLKTIRNINKSSKNKSTVKIINLNQRVKSNQKDLFNFCLDLGVLPNLGNFNQNKEQ